MERHAAQRGSPRSLVYWETPAYRILARLPRRIQHPGTDRWCNDAPWGHEQGAKAATLVACQAVTGEQARQHTYTAYEPIP